MPLLNKKSERKEKISKCQTGGRVQSEGEGKGREGKGKEGKEGKGDHTSLRFGLRFISSRRVVCSFALTSFHT